MASEEVAQPDPPFPWSQTTHGTPVAPVVVVVGAAVVVVVVVDGAAVVVVEDGAAVVVVVVVDGTTVVVDGESEVVGDGAAVVGGEVGVFVDGTELVVDEGAVDGAFLAAEGTVGAIESVDDDTEAAGTVVVDAAAVAMAGDGARGAVTVVTVVVGPESATFTRLEVGSATTRSAPAATVSLSPALGAHAPARRRNRSTHRRARITRLHRPAPGRT